MEYAKDRQFWGHMHAFDSLIAFKQFNTFLSDQNSLINPPWTYQIVPELCQGEMKIGRPFKLFHRSHLVDNFVKLDQAILETKSFDEQVGVALDQLHQ